MPKQSEKGPKQSEKGPKQSEKGAKQSEKGAPQRVAEDLFRRVSGLGGFLVVAVVSPLPSASADPDDDDDEAAQVAEVAEERIEDLSKQIKKKHAKSVAKPKT